MISTGCAGHELTILVPYRDRLQHLQLFVVHMERFLEQRPFLLRVIEQGDDKPFNRGALLNAGLLLGDSRPGWLALHDVDMLPLNDSCDYSRPTTIRHLAGAAEQFDYGLPYANYFGGVLVTTIAAFETVNGFSNNYWGWGGEDDDLFLRFWLAGVPIQRMHGKYRSLPHLRRSPTVANRVRHERTLNNSVVALNGRGDIHPWVFHRSDPGTICVARGSVSPPSQYDGLSTLRCRLIRRRPLRDLCEFGTTIQRHHEFMTVELLGEVEVAAGMAAP